MSMPPRDRAQFRRAESTFFFVDHGTGTRRGGQTESPLDTIELGMRAAGYLRGWHAEEGLPPVLPARIVAEANRAMGATR